MKTVFGIVLLLLVLLVRTVQAEQYFSLNDIKVNSQPTFSQIVIPIPEETVYIARELNNPPGIILNLFPLRADIAKKQIDVLDKFIQEIHLLKESDNVVKAIINLNASNYNFFISSQAQPKAVIIDIRQSEKDTLTALLSTEATEIEKFGFFGQNTLFLDSRQNLLEKQGSMYRIVIDPGHGGKDPGAIGPTGTKEKDITLAVAKKLSDILKQNAQIEVILTRDNDEFIPLDRRTEIANQARGDLFISIHANAAWDTRERGIETFYNSHYTYGEGAKDVAMRENAALGANDLPSSVKNILWDLIQNQYRQESREFAQNIQETLVTVAGTHDRGVKSAPFYVLRGASMPSILVEVGFISNSLEERKLNDPEHQKIIASGIHKGIIEYINSFTKKLNNSRE